MHIPNHTSTTPDGLIGLDWGTSSLRAYRFADDGRVIDSKSAPLGILAVPEGRFAQAWQSLCQPWLDATPSLPVIASGMIGSRQGWREAAYLPTPAGFDELGAALTVVDDLAGRVFRIVAGLSHRHEQLPDVMRGEETQVVGLLRTQASHDGSAVSIGAPHLDASRGSGASKGHRRIVLPGTHSKWVTTDGERIVAFRSYMTGEVYAVMQKHSILGRTGTEPAPDDGPAMQRYWHAFDAAVQVSARQPQSLLSLFFSTRSRGLFGELDAVGQTGWLSGLVIGAEIGSAIGDTTQAMAGAPIGIVGSSELAQRYARALALVGWPSEVAQGEPAAAGLFAIAQQAGLLTRTR